MMIFSLNKLCTSHETPFLVEQTLIFSISGCMFSNIINTCDSILIDEAERLNDFSLIHSLVENNPPGAILFVHLSPFKRV